MAKPTQKYLQLDLAKELQIYGVGRWYRPLATPERPIITKVDWKIFGICNSPSLGHDNHPTHFPSEWPHHYPPLSVGGSFLNTAHFRDGVALSLGSGKVLCNCLLE
jgi:hypothetical protein